MTMLRFIAEWALRSSALIVAGAVLLRVSRVKDSSVRLVALTALLAASLAVPVLMAVAPGLAVIPSRQEAIAERVVANTTDAALNIPTPTAANREAMPYDWTRIVIVLYGSVAGVLLLRWLVGLVLSGRLLRSSRKTGMTVEGIEVRESERLSIPVTLGIVHPAIVLPGGWREWEQTKVEAVVAHEASHVRRRDPLVQALSAVHRAALWFTPLSWFLHERIVRAAEEASDDAALAGVDRESYAGILLDFMRGEVRPPAWQGVAMARYGSPEKRIRRILNEGVLSRGVTIGSVLVIAALAFPLAYVTAAVREAGPQIVKAPVVAATPVVPANAGTAAVPPALAKEAQGTEAGRQQATTTRATTTTKETKSTQDTAGPIRRYVIVQGSDRMSGSWDSDTDDMNDLRTRYGDRFAWFRQNGHEYVITDAGVLAEFDKAMEPQKNVNRMQNEVNGEQSRVNGMQAQVNAHQNDVNALQGEVNRRQNLVNEIQNAVNRQDNATLVQKTQELQQMAASKPEANQAAVNRKQAEVNQEQSGVNGEQSKVNAMQSKVNDEQHRVNAEFNKKMQDIFGSALQKGLAKEVK